MGIGWDTEKLLFTILSLPVSATKSTTSLWHLAKTVRRKRKSRVATRPGGRKAGVGYARCRDESVRLANHGVPARSFQTSENRRRFEWWSSFHVLTTKMADSNGCHAIIARNKLCWSRLYNPAMTNWRLLPQYHWTQCSGHTAHIARLIQMGPSDDYT